MIFKPMMVSDDNSALSYMFYSKGRNVLMAFSDSGDTYSISAVPENAYGYGNVVVHASILDELGWDWRIDPSLVRLALSESAVDVSEESYDVILSEEVYGATGKARARATYISDVLSVGDDFGFWKDISWTQNISGGRVVIAVKVAGTVEGVAEKDWEYYFESPASYGSYPSGASASLDLDRFNLKGSHLMFKVEMDTEIVSGKPSVADFKVSYAAKHSVFFFTNRIRIDSEGFDTMIITASSTLPSKTEISFAVGPGNSAQWKDYVPVELGRVANVPDAFGSRSKVGIRMTSFDLDNFPIVHEFALEFGADSDNKVNEEGLL